MSFLARLLGRDDKQQQASGPDDLGDRRGNLPGDALVLYSGPPREVVGESHYRAAIESVTGGAHVEGVKLVTWASLVAEHDNPYDSTAVAVHVDGLKVGHLSRDEAAAYRGVLERIAAHGKVAHCRADIYGGWNRSRHDVGDYSITLYIAGPDKQGELVAVELEGRTRAEIAAARPPMRPGRGQGPGFFRGRHNSEWFAEVNRLRQAGDDAAAEEILLGLVDATEQEARVTGHGVTPGGYEQLAVIYRKRKQPSREIDILQRFAGQPHAPGVMPAKLLQRLAALQTSKMDG
ncbi:MAG: HIRAN domain-containing protein [Chloroflexi bacterium]|nr:HIRAN domain-containing protein [Chloroflexota bacterium]